MKKPNMTNTSAEKASLIIQNCETAIVMYLMNPEPEDTHTFTKKEACSVEEFINFLHTVLGAYSRSLNISDAKSLHAKLFSPTPETLRFRSQNISMPAADLINPNHGFPELSNPGQ